MNVASYISPVYSAAISEQVAGQTTDAELWLNIALAFGKLRLREGYESQQRYKVEKFNTATHLKKYPIYESPLACT